MLHAIERQIHFKYGLADGISAIYLHTALRRLSLSLVGIFFPVYIFIKSQEYWGYTISDGLYGVIIYYLLWVITKTFLLVPTANLIAKFGYRWIILTSNVFWMALLVIFYLSYSNTGILVFAPIIHAFATTLYWLSYHSLFAEDGHVKHLGEEVGKAQLFGTLASVAGPIVGGLTIDQVGFPALFLISFVILSISGLPFFFLPKHKPKSGVSVRDLIIWFKDNNHANEIISIFGRGMEEKVTNIFWPIYVFIIAGTYAKQGFAASFGMFAGFFAIYYSGKFMDKKNNKNRFLWGSVGTSLLWLIKGFVTTFRQLLFVDVLMNIISPFYWVNFETLVYKDIRIKGENNLVFTTAKLLIINMSYIIVLITALLLVNTSFKFFGIIVLASLGPMLSYLIWEPKSNKGS